MNEIKVPEQLRQFGSILAKGAAIQLAPGIARGILLEILSTRHITVVSLSKLIEEKANLWDLAGERYQNRGRQLVERVGNLNWLTTTWVIGAIKDDYPGVASLLIGWKKAANWLDKQVDLVKRNLNP